MVKRLALKQWSDWLELGSTDDSRLLHSDKSDRILVCSAHLGQGYIQEIILGDDLTLVIKNYRLDRDLIIDTPSHDSSVQFLFPLTDSNVKYGVFYTCFGLREILHLVRSRQPIFQVQIIFTQSTLMTYAEEFIARLLPQTLDIAERATQSIHRYQEGYSTSNTKEMLDRILQNAIDADSNATLAHILSDTVYPEIVELDHAGHNLISATMERVIGQILSCPYQSSTRRTYLKQKALQLVDLYFEEAMLRSHLNQFDLDYIYQAGKILRNQSFNPPTTEMLAKQVGASHSKLNRGFHQLYNTTPFDYLRKYRLRQAWKLLMTSELSVEAVATKVGYKSRSNFATAFRQHYGINPKVFQVQVRQDAN